MNYIKEINAFYDRMELDGLTTSEIVLWHTLMHFHNKAGWREEITLAATSIFVKSGLTESSLQRARKLLQEKGYLVYRSGTRNQAPGYRLLTREYPETGRISNESVGGNEDAIANDNANANTHEGKAVLLKQKETKRDKTTVVETSTENPHTF